MLASGPPRGLENRRTPFAKGRPFKRNPDARAGALAWLAYAPALRLPLIFDDYVQIRLARDFGPLYGWPKVAADPLYRCRETSLALMIAFAESTRAASVSKMLLPFFLAAGLYASVCSGRAPITWT